MRRALAAPFVLLLLAACGSSAGSQDAQGPCKPTLADTHAAKGYAYEVATNPARPVNRRYWPPGNNAAWGWMPQTRRLRVGDSLCENRRLWRIAAIEPLPGDGKPFGILGWDGRAALTLEGRLVLRPAAT
ncbi:MAG: hypothetical protein ACREJ3_01025 [Polyangiaceae bacterium]